MILEGVVTTLGADGTINTAPMGPLIEEGERFAIRQFTLRPFQTSQTFANLKAHPQGVLHVTDDVLLLAQATIGRANPMTFPATKVRGRRLADCCRLYEFKVVSIDDAHERATIQAKVVHQQHVREFFGLNRAKHAVVEAAILASRVQWLAAEQVDAEMSNWKALVDKTGGKQEKEAFQLLWDYIASARAASTEVRP